MVMANVETNSWNKGKQSLKTLGQGRLGSGSFLNGNLPRKDSEHGTAQGKSGSLPRQERDEQNRAYLVVLFHFSSQDSQRWSE